MKLTGRRVAAIGLLALTCAGARPALADSPELSMRDFSSGQIKKGVRSIGFGGDGATWGNYGLAWKDAGTVLADYGDTSYSNGNDFHFVALGATTPSLWDQLAIYLIAMREDTNDLHFNLKSPALDTGPSRSREKALIGRFSPKLPCRWVTVFLRGCSAKVWQFRKCN